jgi:hypothetical protein
LHQERGRGLPQGPGDADQPELAGRVPVERGGEAWHGPARVGYHDRGEIRHRGRGAGGDGTVGPGFGSEGQTVGPGTALGDEEIAGPDLSRVHRDARYLDVQPVQRKGEGAGQVGEKDQGLGERVRRVR